MTLLGLTDVEFISLQPSSGDHVEITVQTKINPKGIYWNA